MQASVDQQYLRGVSITMFPLGSTGMYNDLDDQPTMGSAPVCHSDGLVVADRNRRVLSGTTAPHVLRTAGRGIEPVLVSRRLFDSEHRGGLTGRSVIGTSFGFAQAPRRRSKELARAWLSGGLVRFPRALGFTPESFGR